MPAYMPWYNRLYQNKIALRLKLWIKNSWCNSVCCLLFDTFDKVIVPICEILRSLSLYVVVYISLLNKTQYFIILRNKIKTNSQENIFYPGDRDIITDPYISRAKLLAFPTKSVILFPHCDALSMCYRLFLLLFQVFFYLLL